MLRNESNEGLPESLRFAFAAFGTLPTELGNLSKLSSLVLSDSFFTGDIPSELGRLSLLGKPRFKRGQIGYAWHRL